MTCSIQRIDGEFVVPASLIADGLKLSVGDLQTMMRTGAVTCRHEHGIDSDADRHRLTFLTDHRSFRLTLADEGDIVQRSIIDHGTIARPRFRSAR
jgi:hypothetical protein